MNKTFGTVTWNADELQYEVSDLVIPMSMCGDEEVGHKMIDLFMEQATTALKKHWSEMLSDE
jgi:hypothetical protein